MPLKRHILPDKELGIPRRHIYRGNMVDKPSRAFCGAGLKSTVGQNPTLKNRSKTKTSESLDFTVTDITDKWLSVSANTVFMRV